MKLSDEKTVAGHFFPPRRIRNWLPQVRQYMSYKCNQIMLNITIFPSVIYIAGVCTSSAKDYGTFNVPPMISLINGQKKGLKLLYFIEKYLTS